MDTTDNPETNSDESDSPDPRTDPIEFRPTRLEDLKEINGLLEEVTFDVGLHILRLYYENSDHRWQVATNTRGEIVAFDSSHMLPLREIMFGFDMYVNEKYQNRGIIRRIGSIYLPGPGMGNATAQAMLLFPQMQKYDSKLLGYAGRPRLDQLRLGRNDSDATMTIRTVRTEREIGKAVAYDHESVFLLDRERFVRAWCTESKPDSDEPYARTMMAERDGRVVGFGVIRRYSDFYGLQPLYADDPAVAERLLAALVRTFVEECGPDAHLYVFFDAKNYFMMRFVHEQKFEQCDCEMRQYARGAEVIKDYCRFDRVYSLCDYWPV